MATRGAGQLFGLSERQIQAAVLEHWRALALPDTLVAAIPNANAFGQDGLTPGLFDLIVFTPKLSPAVGFLELKKAGGRLSAAQTEMKLMMVRLGVPYAVTFGRDQPIHVLEEWGAVRPQRAAA
jgi:hypothetical protein